MCYAIIGTWSDRIVVGECEIAEASSKVWWLDGIVAVSLLVACSWLVFGIQAAFRAVLGRWRTHRAVRATAVREPVAEPVA